MDFQYKENKLASDLRFGNEQEIRADLSSVLYEHEALEIIRDANRKAGPQAIDNLTVRPNGDVVELNNLTHTRSLVGRLSQPYAPGPGYTQQPENIPPPQNQGVDGTIAGAAAGFIGGLLLGRSLSDKNHQRKRPNNPYQK